MIPARAGKLRAFSTRNRTLAARAGTGRCVAFISVRSRFPFDSRYRRRRVSSSRDVARQTHFASFAVFRLVETQGAPRVHARSSIYVNLRVRWCNRAVCRACRCDSDYRIFTKRIVYTRRVPSSRRGRGPAVDPGSRSGLSDPVPKAVFLPFVPAGVVGRTPAFVSRHPLRSPNYTPVLSPLDLTLDPSLVSRVTSQSPPAHGVVGLEQRTTTE